MINWQECSRICKEIQRATSRNPSNTHLAAPHVPHRPAEHPCYSSSYRRPLRQPDRFGVTTTYSQEHRALCPITKEECVDFPSSSYPLDPSLDQVNTLLPAQPLTQPMPHSTTPHKTHHLPRTRNLHLVRATTTPSMSAGTESSVPRPSPDTVPLRNSAYHRHQDPHRLRSRS